MNKKCGNGLGENNAKSWNPGSVGGYSRGLQQTDQKSVPDHNRAGAGQKGGKK